MAIYLFVEKGPKKGGKFKISGGEKIGRDQGDIVLGDKKVSSLHAIVKKALVGGGLFLQDSKSKNGIVQNGEKVEKLKLTEGVEFRIGENYFRVLSEEESTASIVSPEMVSPENSLSPIDKDDDKTPSESEDNLLDNDSSIFAFKTEGIESSQQAQSFELTKDLIDEDSDFVEVETRKSEKDPTLITTTKIDDLDLSGLTLDQLTNDLPDQKRHSKQSISVRTLDTNLSLKKESAPQGKRTWSEVLEKFTRSQLKQTKDVPIEVHALTPRVKLTFFRGPQAETEWELGFGPRIASRESLDLPILEEGAPLAADLFKICPSESGPTFFTDCLDIVTLNGRPQTDVLLNSGDIISILATEIEVNLF